MPQQGAPAASVPAPIAETAGPAVDTAALPHHAGSTEGRGAGLGAAEVAAVTAAAADLALGDLSPTASGSVSGHVAEAATEAEGESWGAAAGATTAGPHPGNVAQLTYVGVGEAGWGCATPDQAFRGCKWTAQAGVVLRMPDHARLAAAAAAARAADPLAVPAVDATRDAGGAAGTAPAVQPAADVAVGCSSAASGERRAHPCAFPPPQPPDQHVPHQPPSGTTPVFVFRSWRMQLAGQAAVLRGVQRCDWQEYGFQLERAEAGTGGSRGVQLPAAARFASSRQHAVHAAAG